MLVCGVKNQTEISLSEAFVSKNSIPLNFFSLLQRIRRKKSLGANTRWNRLYKAPFSKAFHPVLDFGGCYSDELRIIRSLFTRKILRSRVDVKRRAKLSAFIVYYYAIAVVKFESSLFASLTLLRRLVFPHFLLKRNEFAKFASRHVRPSFCVVRIHVAAVRFHFVVPLKFASLFASLLLLRKIFYASVLECFSLWIKFPHKFCDFSKVKEFFLFFLLFVK